MNRTSSFESYYNRLINIDYSPGKAWKKVLSHRNYADLWAVGFDSSSKHLLCFTGDEREIWCLDSLTLIHQEERTEDDERICDYHSTIKGFGCLEGKVIQMVSIFGGGLIKQTNDNWKLHDINLHWPHRELLLIPPRSDSPMGSALKIHAFCATVVGYGFSPNGEYFVIAERDELSIYARS